jgi:predicted nucleic acid-binding Zn ribbon protein
MVTAPMLKRTCPACGAEVPPSRTFCKLSCRLAHDRQQVRTPRLFPAVDLFEGSELPSDAELADDRRARRRR